MWALNHSNDHIIIWDRRQHSQFLRSVRLLSHGALVVDFKDRDLPIMFAKITNLNIAGEPFHKQQNCISDVYTHCWKNTDLMYLFLMSITEEKIGSKKSAPG